MVQNRNHKTYGDAGEELATQFLVQEGYRILCRNFRCRHGEIDIIAKSDGYLCFVEVKRRKNTASGHPCEAIGVSKIRRICNTALYYLHCHRLSDTTAVRFDVISIVGEEVSLIKDAFSFQC